ncbi:MAG TPA: hypothetical protein VLC09_09635, partial [Polyangiaceae bacterium]|nr:hypothetical protein [Polyangiaceae bacterium]
SGGELDGFRELTLARMRRAFPVLSARRAVPLQAPPRWAWTVLTVGAVAALLFAPLPARPVDEDRGRAAVAAVPGRLATPELERALTELRQRAAARGQDELVRQMAAELEGLGSEPDPAEALRRLAAWEAELALQSEQQKGFEQALVRRGEAMGETRTTRELMKALRSGSGAEVARALEQLAERLESPREKLSERELAELRRAVEEARQAREEEAQKKAAAEAASQSEASQLEERTRRLREQREKGELSPESAAELERNERTLQRLGGRKQEQERTMDELDRRLAEAARALADEQRAAGGYQRKAAEQLKGAAEQLREQEERALGEAEKQELLEQIEKLREELRRRREQGGDGEEARQAFERRARGQDGGASPSGSSSSSGRPGKGGSAGQAVPVPIEAPGSAASRGSGPGTKGPGESGNQPGAAGDQPGTSHDENLVGDASARGGGAAQDVAAVAQDSGAGPSQRETIRSAARAGFARGPYRALYQDYQNVAEELMRKDAIPPGYKSHVQRYFEMIRPRSEAARPQE